MAIINIQTNDPQYLEDFALLQILQWAECQYWSKHRTRSVSEMKQKGIEDVAELEAYIKEHIIYIFDGYVWLDDILSFLLQDFMAGEPCISFEAFNVEGDILVEIQVLAEIPQLNKSRFVCLHQDYIENKEVALQQAFDILHNIYSTAEKLRQTILEQKGTLTLNFDIPA